MELARLQQLFVGYVDRPGDAMEAEVVAASREDAGRRLAVYRHAYRSRMVEALATDYQALNILLGPQRFQRLALDFVFARPSRHFNFRWYGAELPVYLRRSSRYRSRPILAELAAFEWALGLAFDAEDQEIAGVDDLSRVAPADWPALRLRLHPSATRLTMTTNAPAIWRAHHRKHLPAVARRRRSIWLVWRKGLAPHYRKLEADEAWAIEALDRRADLAELCAGLARRVGASEAPARAAGLLKRWIREGLIPSANFAA